MEYENYVQWMEFSYEEFRTAMETLAINVIKSWIIIISLSIAIAVIMYFLGRKSRYKVTPETNRKLKQICRWEERPIRYQVKHIIEMYVDAYTEKNKIDWDQRLF